MKYIRTKDRIIDLSKVTIGENGWKNIKEYVSFKLEEQQEPIKQADTIEELCDAFVIFYNKSHHKVSILKSMATARLYCKRDKRYNGNYVDKVYGAIWTDKGLIYVAKMNDKGELELL